MSNFKMDDYVDVAERIVEFRTKHPEGSLQQVSIDFREVAGKSWVIFTAAAYRTPEDPRPGQGTAWEPIPGLTPFTKGSEVQNAETAAWGRAIVAALAADTKRGIASAQEIRNRSAEREQEQAPRQRPRPQQAESERQTAPLGGRTEKQAKMLAVQMKQAGLDQNRDEALSYFSGLIGHPLESTKDLTVAEASKIIDTLVDANKQGVNLTTGEQQNYGGTDPWAAQS